MSNSPLPDRESSGKKPMESDDWIGIVVAFTTIGTILAWSFTQMDRGSNLLGVPLTSTSPISSTFAKTDRTPELPQTRVTPSLEITSELLETPVTPSEEIPVPKESTTITKPKAKTKPQSSQLIIPPLIGSPTASEQPEPTEVAPTEVPTSDPEVSTPQPEIDTPSPVNFSDVPEDFWARPFIVPLVERGLFGGVRQGTFQPDRAMTRAEFAVEVQKAFDPSPTRESLNYQDVSGDRANAEAIDSATKTGFLRGYPGQIFQPDRPITRAQVLVSLASGLGLNQPPDTSKTLQRYEDANGIPQYGMGPVAAATEAGLVVNYPKLEQFNPEKAASRAEVASFLYQALVRQGKVEKIPSEYIVEPN